MGFGVVWSSRKSGLRFAQPFLEIAQTVQEVTQLRVDFGKVGIVLKDFFVDRNRYGPLLLPAEKLSHDKACFRAIAGFEGAVQLLGHLVKLFGAEELAGCREMLEQFRG